MPRRANAIRSSNSGRAHRSQPTCASRAEPCRAPKLIEPNAR
jgi:hypothetical protein